MAKNGAGRNGAAKRAKNTKPKPDPEQLRRRVRAWTAMVQLTIAALRDAVNRTWDEMDEPGSLLGELIDKRGIKDLSNDLADMHCVTFTIMDDNPNGIVLPSVMESARD